MVMCARRSEHTTDGSEILFALIVRCNSIDSFGSILGTFSALIVQYCQSKPEKDMHEDLQKKVYLNKIIMIVGTLSGNKSMKSHIQLMSGKVKTF